MRMSGSKMARAAVPFFVLWAAVLGTACRRAEKQSLSPPQPQQQSAVPAPGMGAPPLVDSRGHAVPSAPGGGESPAGGQLIWNVPAGWVEEPPSSSMRKAQYALPAAAGDPEGGQCAVFYFGPGQGGDIQANIDRWASQLTDASGGHPTPTVAESNIGGRKVLKVSMEGTYTNTMGGDSAPKPGTLLLGAIVEGADANWFFKCTGPKKTMESHRQEFDALIASVHAS
jgi:hypothetical protein